MKELGFVVSIFWAIFLVSCTANQVVLQSKLIISADKGVDFLLKESITIKAINTKATILRSGTRWEEVGSIEQGIVYRTRDQVVVVNSFNVHEGYIVVNQASVVGYYLPVEKTFVETKPITLQVSKKEI